MKLKEMLWLAVGSRAQKAVAWQALTNSASRRYGLPYYSPHMVWKDQPYFLAARKAAEGIEGIPDPRSFVLQSSIRSLAALEGDVAECGVRRGRSTIFMLTAETRPRTYHLFDSFAGLSQPTSEDRGRTGESSWAAGDLATDEKVARENLASFSNLIFHVGWIPDKFPEVADRRFVLVHIDVDLYEPTRDSLAFFYDRTVSGGLIICDDYGSSKCPGARRAFDEFFASRPEGIVELPTGQSIVHKL